METGSIFVQRNAMEGTPALWKNRRGERRHLPLPSEGRGKGGRSDRGRSAGEGGGARPVDRRKGGCRRGKQTCVIRDEQDYPRGKDERGRFRLRIDAEGEGAVAADGAEGVFVLGPPGRLGQDR